MTSERWQRIFPIGALAVLVTVSVTGCPNRQRAVDTSQTILVETGGVLADVGRAVNAGASAAGDAAIDRAMERVEAGECESNEDREECAVRFLREEQALWYGLTTALESAHAILATWEEANDAWRASDERPPAWEEMVCRPVGGAISRLLELLEQSDIEISQLWREALGRAQSICELGVVIAEAVETQEEE